MSPELPPPPPPPHPSFNPAPGGPVEGVKTSAAAVWSLILGALSLVCCCISGLPGLILGIVALVNIGKSQGRLKGKGLAITGIILSCLFSAGVGGVAWSNRNTSPELRKAFGSFFKDTEEVTKSTAQATQLATALKAYADRHDGELPPDLESLVSENLVELSVIEAPSGVPDPTFWTLVEGGSKLSDLDANEIILKGGPLKMIGQELYICVRANWTVEALPAAKAK